MNIRELPEALDAQIRALVGQKVGIDPEEISVEEDGTGIFVNWSTSMKLSKEERAAVKEAVKAILPPEFAARIVSIT